MGHETAYAIGVAAGFDHVIESKHRGSVSAAMQGPDMDQTQPQMSLYVEMIKGVMRHASSVEGGFTPTTTARMTPRVAMLAMIMAGLSTMSPYTNHSSKATETSDEGGQQKCRHGVDAPTLLGFVATQAMMPRPPATSPMASTHHVPWLLTRTRRPSSSPLFCLFGGTFMWSVNERFREFADYAAMTVAELKDALRAKGLPVSGRKAELVERLLATNPSANSSTTSITPPLSESPAADAAAPIPMPMGTIEVDCGSCGQRLSLPASHTGRFQCPSCGTEQDMAAASPAKRDPRGGAFRPIRFSPYAGHAPQHRRHRRRGVGHPGVHGWVGATRSRPRKLHGDRNGWRDGDVLHRRSGFDENPEALNFVGVACCLLVPIAIILPVVAQAVRPPPLVTHQPTHAQHGVAGSTDTEAVVEWDTPLQRDGRGRFTALWRQLGVGHGRACHWRGGAVRPGPDGARFHGVIRSSRCFVDHDDGMQHVKLILAFVVLHGQLVGLVGVEVKRVPCR